MVRLGRGSKRQVGLLPKVVAAVVATLAIASLATTLVETRITRQQIEQQASSLFSEVGEVLDARISTDAVRTNQLMSTVTQQLFADPTSAALDADDLARQVLSVVRTTDPDLALVGVIDVASGHARTLGLPSRHGVQAPDPQDAVAVARRAGSSQRIVPLEGGGYGLVYVLPIERLGTAPRLLVAGFALDTVAARRYLEQTGVDTVELVVDGAVVARAGGAADTVDATAPAAGWERARQTQRLEDGRLVRYVALGADRPWDTPAAIGLIIDDPLSPLDGALARTRFAMLLLLMVVGGGLAYGVARVFTRPLVGLTSTAAAIAGGDLDRAFDVYRGDEIGRLADALERMRRGLRAQLMVIRRQARALQDAARRVVAVQDAERQRVAQDLHDGIQQQLVLLRMQVGAARRELHDDPERLEEVTKRLNGAIDHLLDQLRSTGQQLFPAILRDRGLGPALFSLAGRFEIPVDVAFDPDPLPRLDSEVEINAYFLVSEAVLNAAKHARAQRVTIEVQVDAEHLYVRVEDDGVGFDPHGTGHRGGLLHMRDRAQALGGVLDVTSAPGEGARVDATFPLRGRKGSVVGALQVEEDGGDAPVEIDLLRQPQLPEDRVGVLLDRAIGDGQLPGDRRVPPA